jgi:uncharacterized ferredoxin-like protein
VPFFHIALVLVDAEEVTAVMHQVEEMEQQEEIQVLQGQMQTVRL